MFDLCTNEVLNGRENLTKCQAARVAIGRSGDLSLLMYIQVGLLAPTKREWTSAWFAYKTFQILFEYNQTPHLSLGIAGFIPKDSTVRLFTKHVRVLQLPAKCEGLAFHEVRRGLRVLGEFFSLSTCPASRTNDVPRYPCPTKLMPRTLF